MDPCSRNVPKTEILSSRNAWHANKADAPYPVVVELVLVRLAQDQSIVESAYHTHLVGSARHKRNTSPSLLTIALLNSG